MNKFSLILIFLTIFLFFSSSALAASITLSNGNPTVISDADQEYQVDVSLSINTSDGTIYYLRGAFYQPGTNNYCGYTWNGSNWYNGPYTTNEGWKNLLAVTVSSDSATTTFKGKLDTYDSGCKNSGIYNFKVQRFTQSGSGTFDSQNEQTITVAVPTPTSSPTSIPTVTPTSKPIPTPKPTSTPKPAKETTIQALPTLKSTPTSIHVSTLTVSSASQVTFEPIAQNEIQQADVLGENSSSATISNIEKNEQRNIDKKISLPVLTFLIIGGIGCIGAAVILSYRNIKRQKTDAD